MSSARAIPRTTSSEHSPVQSATELAYSGNRPRNWPPTPVSESGGRPQFQTLNAPLYPSGNNSRSHPQRGTSPPPYYGGGSGGSSSGNGYGYNAQGSTSGVSSLGRSPMLPAIAALDHSHQHSSHTFPPAQQQQQSSHLRDTGYSPLLPPIAPGSSGSASHWHTNPSPRPYGLASVFREPQQQQWKRERPSTYPASSTFISTPTFARVRTSARLRFWRPRHRKDWHQ
ncbi:hypothetical protein BS47DRAFT_360023 [Hydnum rufescens UP504]|uniref:Uncharacterized protein n=1 Tax=Hydnum rufescens UP504 TaxID=1448309 RepID=A0A9P6AK02_9AGAM|nr:hypothetical protein BS47DRAFT_360023 [Hydnum rufescens UP504]